MNVVLSNFCERVVWQANTSGKKMFTVLTNTCHSTLTNRETFSSAFRMAYVATCVLMQHKLCVSQFMFCLGHTPFDFYVGFIVRVKLRLSHARSFLCPGHVHICWFRTLTWYGSALILRTLHHSSHYYYYHYHHRNVSRQSLLLQWSSPKPSS